MKNLLEGIGKNSVFFKLDLKTKSISIFLFVTLFGQTDNSFALKNKTIVYASVLQTTYQMQTYSVQRQVSGKVTDTNGMPLVGVAVLIKGTDMGVTTGFDGGFEIEATSDNVLVFSYMGYVTIERTVFDRQNIVVELEERLEQLEEVVVQAYRNTTTSKNTSAIATVSSSEIENKPNILVLNALQAKVSGLNVSSGSGQPGASPSVIIRGVGSLSGNLRPLFVIDGVPVDSFSFSGINPNDVESVTVLKDAASAAAYGNRGANGVIIITTKNGKYETGLQVDYSTSFGKSFKQKNNFNLMNSRDLLNFQKRLNIGTGSELTAAEIDILANQNNTDWTDFIFQEGETANHQIGITTGGENHKSYVSLGYSKQEGIIRGTGLERYTFRANLSGKNENDKFSYAIHASTALSESDTATDIGSGSVFSNPIVGAIFGQPYLNPYRLDGSINDDSIDSDAAYPFSLSPYVILNSIRYKNGVFNKNLKTVINANISYKLLKDLTFNANIGADYNQTESLDVVHPESSNSRFYIGGADIQGKQGESFARDLGVNTNLSLVYNKRFGKHELETSVFFENYNFSRKSFGFTQFGLNAINFSPGDGNSFVNGDREENGIYPYIPLVNSGKNKSGLYSYFALVEYDFDNRFGIFANLRRDASFRFVGDNKWGTFYSVSARWNIGRETFIGPESIISDLKLRASYGSSGNERIGGSDILGQADVTRTLYDTGNGYNNTVSYNFLSLGSPDTKWETIKQTNIGIDYGLFNNRFRGALDVYSKNTEDLFTASNISAANGQYAINTNGGELRNRGVEFNTEYDVISGKKVTLTLRGNVSYNENEILSLESGDQDFGATINAVGHPVGAHYLVPYVGVNPANGNALYRDKEGNITEEFNSSDRVINDDALPKIQGGFGFDLGYKGFFLQSNFSFVGNYKRYNDQQRFFQQSPLQAQNFNVSANYNQAWTPENAITTVEGLNSKQNNFGSDKFLHDASYVRLRYLSIGYNLPEKYLKEVRLKGLRLYLQGENLITWSKWQALDVESNIGRRFDFANYPTPRIITFGLDVKL
ncbi:SusC/RagA family TonB-linked outer membrane protein [Lacinutrix sp. Hel_I_90]|uniref:SusC/RagA family TonB-linked outer membrane protein n=1 Tax=Lacinutrix sp. Hel_I_90 TaxID=1249999 RepID=UPI0006976BDF|nr:SusC/RagA family TonB-linked outer membrane protein [Lacinutrix sp. Hel_I_90]